MNAIKQAPLVELVLTRAPEGHNPCAGCAKGPCWSLACRMAGSGCVTPPPMKVWAIVPAGFSDEEASHG